jgi:hypothetical protein
VGYSLSPLRGGGSTKVDALMTLCGDLEARLTDAADTRRALLELTLHEALATA